MRFLGLTLADKVPDAKTIWHFRPACLISPSSAGREQLVKGNIVEKLFDRFKEELHQKNLIANEGKIVDASFVEVPIQRNNPACSRQA